MKSFRFLHISDTYILKSYDGSLLEAFTGSNGETPDDSMKKAADYMRTQCSDLDFVVISGDLVHEGNADDYAHFKALLERCFPDTQLYLCIGNHDRRAAFNEGYLCIGNNSAPYYYAREHKNTGLRIIALDSSYDNSGNGKLDEEQLSWLRSELKNTAAEGTILVIHHPPFMLDSDPLTAARALINSTELFDAIKDSDIFAILSGHTHQANATVFGGIPHYTADSTAFGVTFDNESMSMDNSVGLVSCAAQNRTLAAKHIAYTLDTVPRYSISIEKLMEMMQRNV